MDEQHSNFTMKLNRLFKEKRKPDGTEFTQADVIHATGEVLNRVYLWKLLTGRVTNPSMQVIQSLANIFQVDPSYFFDKTEDKSKPMPLIDQITMRSSSLDESTQKAVLNMIEIIANLENKDKS